ncbi:hypothetical protein [Streptomyces sp. NBC_00820]|uniref:hypothetical protein n=1 Tax=Streptomyces sp. NBC_00820 TaxID=2975842 RepID=UPI002ED292BC
MEEDFRRGATAARRLGEGADLRDVVDPGTPAAWLELDEGVRWNAWYNTTYSGLTWDRTAGGRALRRALGGDAPLSDAHLALALCHGDGRIRHAALERAAGRPALLPLVVLRCADWAPPVRERARELLTAALDVESAVRLAPLLLRVGGRGRGDFGVGLLGDLLSGASPEQTAALFGDRDRTVRRYAYRRAVARGCISPVELARAAARDDDAVVQMLCADAALAAVDEASAAEVLEALLGARSPRARSAGVTALRRFGRPRGDSPGGPDQAEERASEFLADRSALVRGVRAVCRTAARGRSTVLVPGAVRRRVRSGVAAGRCHRAGGVRDARGRLPAVAAAGPPDAGGTGEGGGRAARAGRDGRGPDAAAAGRSGARGGR